MRRRHHRHCKFNIDIQVQNLCKQDRVCTLHPHIVLLLLKTNFTAIICQIQTIFLCQEVKGRTYARLSRTAYQNLNRQSKKLFKNQSHAVKLYQEDLFTLWHSMFTHGTYGTLLLKYLLKTQTNYYQEWYLSNRDYYYTKQRLVQKYWT